MANTNERRPPPAPPARNAGPKVIWEPEPGAVDELPRGTQVGRYILLKPVGEGGMGVVYAAYDPELDRKVALKLLRPADSDTRQGLRRMRMLREAQAMARISHRHVCSVFDAGTFGDWVFVAMEFIEGTTLLHWMEAQRRSWREVLRVLLQAGRGLLAAHKAGLVHRDFKPANVLLGPDERAYVTDFGLARLASLQERVAPAVPEALAAPEGPLPALATGITQGETVMGTPQYMPPEQYLGDTPDPRSDQFSFCVVLYEALYGRMPFEPKAMVRVAVAQARKLPLPPESLQEPPRDVKVPAWVRRAMMRGLSLNPAERFPSMKELLQELSQAPRRVRRRWMALAGGVTLLGLGAAAVGVRRQAPVCDGPDWLVAEVWNPEVRQRLETAFTTTEQFFAVEMARRVSRVLDTYAQAWVRQHTEACVATRVQGVQTEELLSKRVVCLERRRKDLRALTRLLTEGVDSGLVVRAMDVAHALPALQECQDIEALSNQVGLPSEPFLRSEVERLGEKLSEVKALHDTGRYKEALELARQLEPRATATHHRPILAELRYHQGWLRFRLGEAEPGLQQLQQALSDAEAGRADRLKLTILSKLLFAHGSQRQWELAEVWGRLAHALLERLGNDDLMASELLGNLGNVAMLQQQYQEALASFERARVLQDKVLTPEDPRRAKLTFVQGMAASHLGQGARAVELLEESLRQTEAALGRNHPEVAQRHAGLSWALRKVGNLARALEHAQAALDIRKATLGPEHPLVADSMDELGMSLLGLKRPGEALEMYQAALALKQKILGPEHEDLQYSYDGVGQALLELGRTAEAVAPLTRALSFSGAEEEALGNSGFTLARALWVLGQHKRALAEAARARQHYAQAELPERVAEVERWMKRPR